MEEQTKGNPHGLAVEVVNSKRVHFNVHAAIHPETLDPLIHMAVYADAEGERGDLVGVSLMDVNASTDMGLTMLRMVAGSIMTATALRYAHKLAAEGNEAGNVVMYKFLNYLQHGNEESEPNARHWEESDRAGDEDET